MGHKVINGERETKRRCTRVISGDLALLAASRQQ